jgi:hypothetical protein
MLESPNTHSSPFTLTQFFHHPGKFMMPAAKTFYPDSIAISGHHI